MADLHGDPLGIELHSGVARFMKAVYAWTFAGVALTAATAGLLGHSPAAVQALREAPGTGLMWPALPPAGGDWDGVRDRLERAAAAARPA